MIERTVMQRQTYLYLLTCMILTSHMTYSVDWQRHLADNQNLLLAAAACIGISGITYYVTKQAYTKENVLEICKTTTRNLVTKYAGYQSEDISSVDAAQKISSLLVEKLRAHSYGTFPATYCHQLQNDLAHDKRTTQQTRVALENELSKKKNSNVSEQILSLDQDLLSIIETITALEQHLPYAESNLFMQINQDTFDQEKELENYLSSPSQLHTFVLQRKAGTEFPYVAYAIILEDYLLTINSLLVRFSCNTTSFKKPTYDALVSVAALLKKNIKALLGSKGYQEEYKEFCKDVKNQKKHDQIIQTIQGVRQKLTSKINSLETEIGNLKTTIDGLRWKTDDLHRQTNDMSWNRRHRCHYC